MSHLYDRIRATISEATRIAADRGMLPEGLSVADIQLERPRQASHGDLSTNLCFTLGRELRTNPRKLAEQFVDLLREADVQGWIARIEVAGPGFVNLHLSGRGWQSAVADALRDGQRYGTSRTGRGERVLLEFVSANPTGPLHVGHGRGAVLGDALAQIMRAAGYEVDTEYYINNVGNQIAKLGESVWHWVKALAVLPEGDRASRIEGDLPQLPAGFPEDGYRGGYVAELALELLGRQGLHLGLDAPGWGHDAWWAQAEGRTGQADDRDLACAAWRAMLRRIAGDLDALGVRFDSWFSERALHGLEPRPGRDAPLDLVGSCCERLQGAGWAYRGTPVARDEAGGAEDPDDAEALEPAPQGESADGTPLLFRGTREDIPKAFRDSKDRVILRSDSRPTYFAADIAYHDDKLGRGYDHLINVLGADHHGYVSRLKGVIHALGDLRRQEGDPRASRWSGDRLEVILMQMVALLRDGEPVPMGKRSGEFVTLRDVIDEVSTSGADSGRDAVRFIFLTRKGDAQLDFDLEVARRTSMDNPVYYVQYGHARLASILERARTQGVQMDTTGADLSALALDDERQIALSIAGYPEVVARAARAREPHQIAFFLMDACKLFHGYYTRGKANGRVISEDAAATASRLALVAGLKTVVANGLGLLGVGAPDRMENLSDDDAVAPAE